MSATEFQQRLGDAKEKLARLKERIASLERDKADGLASGNADKAVSASKKLIAAAEELVLLEVNVKACEAGVRRYEERLPVAAEFRERLREEIWPAFLAKYERLQQAQAQLGSVLEETTALNKEMTGLIYQHNELIGDPIYLPGFNIPGELYRAATAKLEPLPKELDVRLASERERDRLAKLFKEQGPIVNKILERAGEKWPSCPVCGNLMLAGKRGPDVPAYGMSEDGSRGFANFRCPKHGEQTRDVRFPPRPMAAIPGLPLATPGLADQQKGGEKT